ncbi:MULTISPECIES: helix-turn-helix transcriptional regulator [unclassified Micromonospora]|nr:MULTISPECIES: helix-turn-helix transcriptional regulator [unclassified Micromonospora]MBU8857663.1 helix-turn-helix domain-containing protein [Micromonospora sp. WMMB482]MDM4783291.1 helix-turn-helix transcriptional regulator [Micromonospora sp. b486]
MSATTLTGQAAFARFVRDAVDDAADQHGWSVAEVAERSGVSRSTVFRWLSGDWRHHPELPKVRAFCEALHLPLGAALRVLTQPTQIAAGAPVADPVAEAHIAAIRARLADPRTSSVDRQRIRAGLRRLAHQAPA